MFLMRFTERAYVNYTREDVLNSPTRRCASPFPTPTSIPKSAPSFITLIWTSMNTRKRWGSTA